MFKVVSNFDAFLIKGPFKWIISENMVSVNNAVKGDLAGWHLKDLGFIGDLEKAKVPVSRYSLAPSSAFPRRMGPSLACPDARIFSARAGDIGSISDSHWCQISQQTLEQRIRMISLSVAAFQVAALPSSPLLRRVFGQHFFQWFGSVCLSDESQFPPHLHIWQRVENAVNLLPFKLTITFDAHQIYWNRYNAIFNAV